ncbi:11302_t:CDS:1, partial [Acaulospora colombiana]
LWGEPLKSDTSTTLQEMLFANPPYVFMAELPVRVIDRIETPHTDLVFEYGDSYKEKFNKLDVESQLKISILSGLLALEGSGKYLRDVKNSSRSVKGTLIYHISSVEESLSINREEIKAYIDTDAFNARGATHVVTGIKWGATMMASFEYKNRNAKNNSVVEGILKANFEKVSSCIDASAGGDTDIKGERHELMNHFSINIFGDVIPDNKNLPRSFAEAKEILTELPLYAKKYNYGKGVPFEFKLYPLSELARKFKYIFTIGRMITELSEQTILRVEQVFDDFLKSKKMLNDLYDDARSISDHILDETLSEIEKRMQDTKIEETNFRQKLANSLVRVRSGRCNIDEIEQRIINFQKSMLSNESIGAFIRKYNSISKKAELIFTLKEKNVEYIKKDSTIDFILNKYQYFNLYIFSDNDEYLINGKHSSEHTKFRNLYTHSNNGLSKFLIAERKICRGIKGSNYPVILHYVEGRKVTDNGYSADNEEINILLLGETGVGKSTFINAFANYLKFDSLDDAKSGDMEVLIPSKFTLTNENYEQRVIQVGEQVDDGEQLENSEMSATQKCKYYAFYAANKVIKLIDTPGVGDTRGVDQDAKNFENVLLYISNYQNLNGICILLKPNNSRLTAVFKYCILSLLTHLHKSAKDNIVFCFTNSRGTFYRPGDTLPPLIKQLNTLKDNSGVEIKVRKETTFCFDNESFRFLAATMENVHLPDEDEYARSWEKSVRESLRLMEHVISRPPHKVKDMLSLNNSRKVIKFLMKPLADIQLFINRSVEQITELKEKVVSSEKTIEELTKSMDDIEYEFNVESLESPINVCTNKKCSENNTICCKACHIKIKRNMTGRLFLWFCSSIGVDGKCKACGCSWKMHKQVVERETRKPIQITRSEVAEEVNKNKSEAERKQALIENIEFKLACLSSEKERIFGIKNKFVLFLKQNTIALFNDAYDEYVDNLIKLAKIKGEKERTRALETLKQEHSELREFMRQGGNSVVSSSVISLEEINRLEKELYDLPLSGKKFLSEKEEEERKHDAQFRFTESRLDFSDANKSKLNKFTEFFRYINKLG